METRQSLSVPGLHLRYWLPTWSSLALWLGVLLLLVASAGMLALATWHYWYADRIYPGVYISGLSMAGKTPQEAVALLQVQGLRTDQPTVRVVHGDRQWVLRSTTPDSPQFLADLAAQAYQLGRGGHLLANLRIQGQALGTGVHIETDAVYHAHAIDRFVTRVMQDMAAPPVTGYQGTRIDAGWLVTQIHRAIQEDLVTPIHLQVEAVPTLADSLPRRQPLRQPLRLSHPQTPHQVALDPQMLAAVVQQEEPLILDEEMLAVWVGTWGHLFDRPPRDAKIRFDANTGQLVVHQPGQMGVKLDVARTVTAIGDALQRGLPDTQLHLTFIEPNFRDQDLDQFGIRELVGSGTSYFLGSGADRLHNIALTTAQFDGVLIPPGGIFSFNDNVGPITTAAGYKDSEIIWGDRTAVGVGGGVCQVSTTIFRAAFASGLPIVERYNHGYVVSWYGQPGLDATIYTPTVDFRFRNDTGAYLLLQPELDTVRGTLVINLYGSRPDRTVRISDPVISAVVDPPEPVYLTDSSLAPGERRLVEAEKLGLTVAVERSIEEGGTVHTETLHSVYRPWQAVYLVGATDEENSIPQLDQDAVGS